MSQDTFDVMLAVLLGQYPAIWKRSFSEFKNKIKKENAIQTLAQELSSEVSYVISCIKALREKYRKEKLKFNMNMRSGVPQVETEEWHLFKTLSFFDEVMRTRKTASNFASHEVERTNNVEDINDSIASQDSEVVELEWEEADANLPDKVCVARVTPIPGPSTNKEKRPRRRTCSTDDPFIAAIGKLAGAAESTALNANKQDECDTFGCFVSTQLKKLPENVRNSAMFEVHKILRVCKKQ